MPIEFHGFYLDNELNVSLELACLYVYDASSLAHHLQERDLDDFVRLPEPILSDSPRGRAEELLSNFKTVNTNYEEYSLLNDIGIFENDLLSCYRRKTNCFIWKKLRVPNDKIFHQTYTALFFGSRKETLSEEILPLNSYSNYQL